MAKKQSSSRLATRQKANEIRREQERAQRRRRTLIQVAVVSGAVVAISAFVVAMIFANRNAANVNLPNGSAMVSVGGTEDVPFEVAKDRVRVGAEDATVVLSIYEDYSCPHCQDYEAAIDDTLTELIATGDVAVEYHPLRIVTNYGNRAGSASACVAAGAPVRWLDVHSELFALHDAITESWSNSQFREHLETQGISDDAVLTCVSEGRYAKWIDQNTATARDAGIASTPTLLINGEQSETLNAAQLRDAVDEILSARE